MKCASLHLPLFLPWCPTAHQTTWPSSFTPEPHLYTPRQTEAFFFPTILTDLWFSFSYMAVQSPSNCACATLILSLLRQVLLLFSHNMIPPNLEADAPHDLSGPFFFLATFRRLWSPTVLSVYNKALDGSSPNFSGFSNNIILSRTTTTGWVFRHSCLSNGKLLVSSFVVK